jgi:cytochrome d ubiquinol oxidase subunit I
VVAQHPTATVAGTLFGYVGLYLALMVAYMKALRIMALKPAKRLEEDSNPLGSPLVGAAT